MPLDDLFEKIKVIQEFDIEKETIDIINENDKLLAQMLRTQLIQGKDGDGANVTVFGRDYYHDYTIRYKEKYGDQFGSITSHITNYMSGSFYRSIQFYAQGNAFEADSDVPYFSAILEQSGDKIMELNAEHLKEFSETVLIPELQRRFEARFK